jgi:hypothetical protein
MLCTRDGALTCLSEAVGYYVYIQARLEARSLELHTYRCVPDKYFRQCTLSTESEAGLVGAVTAATSKLQTWFSQRGEDVLGH